MNFFQIKRCAHFESILGQNENKKIIAHTALWFWPCYAKQTINFLPYIEFYTWKLCIFHLENLEFSFEKSWLPWQLQVLTNGRKPHLLKVLHSSRSCIRSYEIVTISMVFRIFQLGNTITFITVYQENCVANLESMPTVMPIGSTLDDWCSVSLLSGRKAYVALSICEAEYAALFITYLNRLINKILLLNISTTKVLCP